MPYNVLSLGQPLLDNVVKVTDEHLHQLGITEKGGSSVLQTAEDLEILLDKLFKLRKEEERLHQLEPLSKSPYSLAMATSYGSSYGSTKSGAESSEDEEEEMDDEKKRLRDLKRQLLVPAIVPGGSCANTIKGLASLGEKCAFIGKIGRDRMGKLYTDRMSKKGVIPLMSESTLTRTGEVVCLVTPDGQRTMRAYLGASVEMNENDLLPQDFKGIKLFHVEGYSIYNLPLTLRAMQLAKQHGAMISYDLGSFEVVRTFKKILLETILPNFVDIIFANEEEAKQLFMDTSPESCVDKLAQMCHVAVVMMGAKGCWVKSQNYKHRCPTTPVQPIDTTGAGDCFASGFLYAYLQGYSLEQCARLGNLGGAGCCLVFGAEMSTEQWKKIKKSVNHELFTKQAMSQEGSKPMGTSLSRNDFSSTSGLSDFGASPSPSSFMNSMKSSLPISIKRGGYQG